MSWSHVAGRELVKYNGNTFVASDYYGDCAKSPLEVAIVFLTQSSLLAFYMLGLYTSGAPDFSNGRVFAFYYAGSRPYEPA